MPTVLPVRSTVDAERLHVPTMVASGLIVAILVVMTVLTPTKYPSMFGASGTAAVHRD